MIVTVGGEAGNGYWRGAQVAADGNFRFGGLPPGIASFSITDYGNKKRKYSIVGLERDGVIQPGGIQIQNGEHLTGLRVVVAAADAATIRGVVKLANAPLPPDVRLLIFLTRAGERVSNIDRPQVDSRGHFVIEGLAPGSYELSVSAYLTRSQQSLPTVKQLISLEEGAVVEVTVDLKPNSEPALRP